MATNRDLLKEAIADAKAVKEMAIANAKAALEEAFTPQLKTMLSTKLQEMEKEEMKEEELDEAGFEKMDSEEKGFDGQFGNINVNEEEDDVNEVDLEELLAELEEEGYYVIKLTGTNKNGIPDLIAIPQGCDVLFSEIKKPNGKLSELQKFRIEQLQKHGVKTEVYRG